MGLIERRAAKNLGTEERVDHRASRVGAGSFGLTVYTIGKWVASGERSPNKSNSVGVATHELNLQPSTEGRQD